MSFERFWPLRPTHGLSLLPCGGAGEIASFRQSVVKGFRTVLLSPRPPPHSAALQPSSGPPRQERAPQGLQTPGGETGGRSFPKRRPPTHGLSLLPGEGAGEIASFRQSVKEVLPSPPGPRRTLPLNPQRVPQARKEPPPGPCRPPGGETGGPSHRLAPSGASTSKSRKACRCRGDLGCGAGRRPPFPWGGRFHVSRNKRPLGRSCQSPTSQAQAMLRSQSPSHGVASGQAVSCTRSRSATSQGVGSSGSATGIRSRHSSRRCR